MNYAMTVNGTIITGVHESLDIITAATFSASPDFAGHAVVPLASAGEYRERDDIRCYNEDGTRQPAVWCIQNGYMEMPAGCEIIDGVLVDKQAPPAEQPPSIQQYVAELTAKADSASSAATAQDGIMADLIALLVAQGVVANV